MRRGRLVLGLASILVLHVLLSIHRWFPEYRWEALLLPGPELLVVLALVLVVPRLAIPCRLVAAAIVAILIFFSLGEGFTQNIFSQPFDPSTDVRQLLPLIAMMTGGRAGPGVIFAALAVLIAGLTALVVALIRALRLGTDQLSSTWRISLGVAVIALALAGAVASSQQVLPVMMVRQTLTAPVDIAVPAVAEPLPVVKRDEVSYALPGIKDRDIVMVVIESYGGTLFSNPAHRELTEPFLRVVQDELARDGFGAATILLDSPTTGGRSWLADSTLLTGVRVRSQEVYDRILESQEENLTHLLGRAGYHRVFLAPGTTSADETWRRRYEFDRYLLQRDFGYRGPLFSFGEMPDQYMLRIFQQRILNTNKETPLFALLLTVSSHVPFDRVPYYFHDWDQITDGGEFDTVDNPRFRNNWLSGGEYPEGYTASIRYVFRTLSDFLRSYLPGDALVILVGDHQPRLPIREKGSTRAVPMHVLSRDKGLIRRFLRRGFTPGLIPREDPSQVVSPGMEIFYPLLLDVALEESPEQGGDLVRMETLSAEE